MKGARYLVFDWLRIALALSVAVHHCLNQCYRQLHGTGWWFAGINPAVPTFLAISGFCITGSWERHPELKAFLAKRVLRIVPAFVAFLALSGFVYGFNQIIFLLISWLTLGIVNGSHLWSLGWEELFYMTFAIASFVGLMRYRAFPIVALALSLAADQTQFAPSALRAGVTLLTCFLIGNVIYRYRNMVQFPIRARWLPLIAFVFLFGLCLYFGMIQPSERLMRSLVIVTALFGALSGIQDLPLPRLAFDASYGVYLFHPFAIVLAFMIVGKSFVSAPILVVLLSLVIGTASWFFIEKPVLSWGRREALSGSPEISCAVDANTQFCHSRAA